MRLESPATHESNQQCFKREPDSEAWSTHTGKAQTSRQLLLDPLNFSCHLFPLDIPRKVTQKAIYINPDPHDGCRVIRLSCLVCRFCGSLITAMFIARYSQLSLFTLVVFCKVTANTELANIEPLLLGEIKGSFPLSLLVTLS